MRVSDWRALAAVVVGGLGLVLAATFLIWLAVAVAIVVAVLAFHLYFLQRWSRMLGVHSLVLATLLLPLLAAAGGLFLGGRGGLLVGLLLWLGGVLAPRLAGLLLARRLNPEAAVWTRRFRDQTRAARGEVDALEGTTCSGCGLVSVHLSDEPGAACPRCGAAPQPDRTEKLTGGSSRANP